MDCQAADEALDAILDGEAHVETRREGLAHLEACAVCQEELTYRQLLRCAIRQGGETVDTPANLWGRIGAGIDATERRGCGRRHPLRQLGFLGASALALVAMIGLLFSYWPLRSPASPFMVESDDNYIRYLLSNAPDDLQPRDADRVRQWFQGRLDRVVAEVGYQRDGHRLSLFMARGKGIEALVGKRVAHGGQEFFVAISKGYTVVAWHDEPANIVCSIVGDLSQEQLLHIARKAARVPS